MLRKKSVLLRSTEKRAHVSCRWPEYLDTGKASAGETTWESDQKRWKAGPGRRHKEGVRELDFSHTGWRCMFAGLRGEMIQV